MCLISEEHGFLNEYILSEFMSRNECGSIYFSISRHNKLGIWRSEIVMWSSHQYQLARAIEIWDSKFEGEIRYLKGITFPPNNLCAGYHFAIGPYRINLATTKCPYLYKSTVDYSFFTIFEFSKEHCLMPIPGYIIPSKNDMDQEELEQMYTIVNCERPEVILSGGVSLKVTQYQNAVVNKFWKCREMFDRDYFNVLTCFSCSFYVEKYLSDAQKRALAKAGSDIERIWSPLDKWQFLDSDFKFGFAKYQWKYHEAPPSSNKRTRIEYDELD